MLKQWLMRLCLAEEHRIRFSGEDCRRGTFFHRHAAVFDQDTGEAYMPLAHLVDEASPHWIFMILYCRNLGSLDLNMVMP